MIFSKISKILASFLHKLVDFGVDPSLPYMELRKAKLMNVITFSISIILIFFIGLNLFVRNYFLAISDVIMIFIVCVPSWFLQYKRHYRANLVLITCAFFIYTTLLTILKYDELRQTEHILIAMAIMPIFLFEGFWKNLMFIFFPISFFTVKFVVMYKAQGYIEIHSMHLIYAITFLIVYVLASYFKGNMMHFYGMLNESNKTKDKLFRIISHDIRNPFSSLLGSSDLQMKYLESGNIEKLEKTSFIINSASKKIYDLTQTLLDWSMTQTETITPKKEKINLTDLVMQIVDFCKISARPKEIQLIYNPKEQVVIYCDNVMTQISLRNIIMNAIKFSHRNSEIQVSIVNSEKTVSIVVQDFGVGMSEENLNNLFNENIIQSNYGTEKEKGTGLGLIICKELIEQQAGKLSVTSVEAKGSIFSIILPKE
jgi:signal transduction histidine kinase